MREPIRIEVRYRSADRLIGVSEGLLLAVGIYYGFRWAKKKIASGVKDIINFVFGDDDKN